MSGVRKMKEYPKWVDNFVTYDIETDEYVAWDETQANELSRGTTRDEMVDVVMNYADSLELLRYYSCL